MNRPLIFLAATAAAAIAVSSACIAHPQGERPFRADELHFTLTPALQAGEVQLNLRSGDRSGSNGMSGNYGASQLAGLDLAALRAGGPVRFAYVREAGRVDCAGQARAGRADGDCRFTADSAFAAELQRNGIARPDLEDSFAMTLTGVSRDLVAALRQANYGTPETDDLIGMAAVGVDRAYIAALASRGYKPAKLGDLIAFRALDISPAYIDEMARSGYRGLDADAIVQFKALGITPGFIRSFAAAGYDKLDSDELVQLKALDITPQFIAGFERIGYRDLPVDTLVQLKALDVTPELVASTRGKLSGVSQAKLFAIRSLDEDRRRNAR